MNGEFQELFKLIKGTLIEPLEKLERERWDAHDKRSKDIWASLQTSIDNLPEKLNTKLSVIKISIRWHDWMIKILWAVLVVGGLAKGVLWMVK